MRLILAVLMFCLAAPVWACQLKASWEPWEPYQFKDSAGKVTGLDNDLISAVAKQAGCSIQLDNMPWKRALKMLETGGISLTSGASKTAEREAYAYFSDPYRDESVAIFVQKSKANQYTFDSLSAFANAGLTIGTTRGYHYGDDFMGMIEKKAIKGKISESSSDEKSLKKLAAGRADVVLIDKYAGAALVKSMGLSSKIVMHSLTLNSADIHFMFSMKSSSKDLVSKFNKALKEMKASGEYDKILNRYLN